MSKPVAEMTEEEREQKREQINAYQRQYREEHPEKGPAWSKKCSKMHQEQRREYNRKYHAAHKEQEREQQQRRQKEQPELGQKARIKWFYKVSDELAEQLITDRKTGVCVICGGVRGKQELVIDHDHATGNIRGVICHKCNVGLGNFEDNTEWLQKAIDYINSHKEVSDE